MLGIRCEKGDARIAYNLSPPLLCLDLSCEAHRTCCGRLRATRTTNIVFWSIRHSGPGLPVPTSCCRRWLRRRVPGENCSNLVSIGVCNHVAAACVPSPLRFDSAHSAPFATMRSAMAPSLLIAGWAPVSRSVMRGLPTATTGPLLRPPTQGMWAGARSAYSGTWYPFICTAAPVLATCPSPALGSWSTSFGRCRCFGLIAPANKCISEVTARSRINELARYGPPNMDDKGSPSRCLSRIRRHATASVWRLRAC